MNNQLIQFYANNGKDIYGRQLKDILQLTPEALEKNHTYIQWLFPLPVASAFNSKAPLLDAETIEVFKSDSNIRENVKLSLIMMREFYENNYQWISLNNHNYLRLTRILLFLNIINFKEEMRSLLLFLDKVYSFCGDKIGQNTFKFWLDACSEVEYDKS